MRYLIGLVFVLALGVMGCSETSGTGGTGNSAGTGGTAGNGGTAGGAAGGSGAGGAVGCTGTPTPGLSVNWALLDGEDPVPAMAGGAGGRR